MARGSDFTGFLNNTYGDFVGSSLAPLTSIAELILRRNDIPFRESVGGSSLPGYDIKSQESIAMLKLSLLADGTEEGFPEIYTDYAGFAIKVIAGKDIKDLGLKQCLLKVETSNFVNKIDHVLVKGKDPLPYRYTKGAINVMGGGAVYPSPPSCITGNTFASKDFGQEAWAGFGSSLQSPAIQASLKAAVRRSQWENLVGYKVRFADVPSYASISLSQSTPRSINIPFSSDFNTVYTLNLGASFPDGGGIVDVSALNATGAAVLDLVKGSDLRQSFTGVFVTKGTSVSGVPQTDPPTFTVANLMDDISGVGAETASSNYKFTDNDFYCLLDHQCGLITISRGTNWFLSSAGGNNASLQLRRGASSLNAEKAFSNFSSNLDAQSINYFRRKDGGIANIKDYVTSSIGTNDSPAPGQIFNTLNGRADTNRNRGTIVEGIGGNNGTEIGSLDLAYTVSQASIAVKSPHGDAAFIASRLTGGVTYDPIVVADPPAPTGWASSEGTIVVYPVAPPDTEGIPTKVESPIEELQGTVMDIAAPYLGEAGVVKLASKISTLINGDNGKTTTLTYRAGGYKLLPGMRIPEGVIQTIEFSYNDGESISTNITTGPLYYPVGSYGDSQYVKRSESFSRDAWVVAGDNSSGTFIVDVAGLGRYEAINGDLQTIYPGDKVEVKLMNVPVELD